MALTMDSCYLRMGGPIDIEQSRSFMTMTVTIWWPRSDVRICQIVTEVTSDVGVPLTHLVFTTNGNYEADDIFKTFNS